VTSISKEYPRLSKPPLREALIDIRLRDELPANSVDAFRQFELPGFSQAGDIKLGGFSFQLGPGSPQASVTKDVVQGIRFQSADGSQVVQFRRNGMTYSILRNYTDWAHFEPAARRMWGEFLNVAGTTVAVRLGVRYINAIDVPLGADFDHYLTAVPHVPEVLPQLLSSFFQRIVVPFADLDTYVIITQAFERPSEGTLPTVLDIDVGRNCTLDARSVELWNALGQLRNIKNDVFFGSVTSRALEAYR
jgi:uncharacterized protein (TIGR04255 family)